MIGLRSTELCAGQESWQCTNVVAHNCACVIIINYNIIIASAIVIITGPLWAGSLF